MNYENLVEKIKTDANGKKRTVGEKTKMIMRVARKAILQNREQAKKLTDQEEIDDMTSDQNNFATMIRLDKENKFGIDGTAFHKILNRKYYIYSRPLKDDLIQRLNDHRLRITTQHILAKREGREFKQNVIIRKWGRQYITASGELAYTKVERIYFFENEFYSTRGGHWRRVCFFKLFVDLHANAEQIIEGYKGSEIQRFVEDIFDINIYENEGYFTQDEKNRFAARKAIAEVEAKHKQNKKALESLESVISKLDAIGENTDELENKRIILERKINGYVKPLLPEMIDIIKKEIEALKSPKKGVIEGEIDFLDQLEDEGVPSKKGGVPKSEKQKQRREQKVESRELEPDMVDVEDNGLKDLLN